MTIDVQNVESGPAPGPTGVPMLELRAVSKNFGPVQALRDVDLHGSEVLADRTQLEHRNVDRAGRRPALDVLHVNRHDRSPTL